MKLFSPVLLGFTLFATSFQAQLVYVANSLRVAVPRRTLRAKAIKNLGTVFCLVASLGLGSISGLASSPVTQYAYVTNTGAGTLSIINTGTGRVVNTVDLSGSYPKGAAITPDGQYVYLITVGSNSTLVFDTSTQSIVNSIDMGNNNPQAAAVTPDGRSIYVSEVNPPSYSGAIAVIDTATQTIVNTIDVGDLGVGQLQVTPDGSQLYLVVAGGVVVIDTAAQSVVKTIDIPSATGLAVTPDGNQVYVTSLDNDSVYVIDTATQSVIKTVGVGPGPTSCAVTPDGLSVFVGNSFRSKPGGPYFVSVIDTTTQAVVRTINLKGAPQGVAVTPTGSYAYVVTRSPDAVSIISTSNGGSRSVSVGFSPAVFGNFIGPNLITDVLEVSSEQALTGLGFGRIVDFQGGTLEAKASLTDAHTLSLSAAGGTINSNGFALTFSGDIIGARRPD